MENKKNEMLTDEELDNVVGGGNYCRIQYAKIAGEDKYQVKISKFSGDAETWEKFLSGQTVSSISGSTFTASQIIPASKWDAYQKRLNERYPGVPIEQL